jgi:nucleotide-binding universal stress UspA family protein
MADEPAAKGAYRVVVGVDYSALSERAIEYALELARDRDGSLECVTVGEGGPGMPEDAIAHEKQSFVTAARATLESFVSERVLALERSGVRVASERIHAHVCFGDAADAITDLARRLDADLIVVGTTGRHGLDQALLGSVAERVLRHAHCSVLAVRPKR